MTLRYTALSALMALALIACSSPDPKPNAHAAPPPGPKALPGLDDPKKFGAMTVSYSDTTTPEWRKIARRLDSFYNVQTRAGFNGAVLIGYKGKVLYERYYGMANKENGQPWATNTSSQLASTSKTFTGAAILFLHEHKYLNIDDPVTTYLPSFPYPGITVRMLLCHRSGLPDYLKWYGLHQKDSRTPITNAQMLAMMAQYKPALDFKPNTHFKYSNSNYAILASIIESVTEMRYHDFMRKYVFEPLGMKNTFVFDAAQGLPTNASISYKATWAREPVMFADGIVGDKGTYSTAQDMYRWDQSFYQNRLLDNETMEMAYGPCSFEKPGIKNYGLGWRMLCYPDGYKVIYHNGWWHGNNTCFYRFVKDNFTIIVLGNKYTTSIYRQPPVIFGIVNSDTTRNGGFGGEE